MNSHELPAGLLDALRPLPTAHGGKVLVLATGGEPPAMAMLSTGDVWLTEGRMMIAVHATSSVGRRLGAGCTLLVPGASVAYRIEMGSLSSRSAGALILVEGDVTGVRPTAEPPWCMELRFYVDANQDPVPFVDFWREVRAWLVGGAVGDAPAPPL
jgi:hypothetical protein